MKDKYSQEEIAVILAHEMAHYKLKHILKLSLLSAGVTLVSFYVIFKTVPFTASFFGIGSLADIAGLPLVILYLSLLEALAQPLQNYFSRRMEVNADLLALRATGAREAFIAMMDKLALQNLADRNPAKWIKVIFFDHPPISERIALARKFK